MAEILTTISLLGMVVLSGIIRLDTPRGVRHSRICWTFLGLLLSTGLFAGWLGLGWEPETAVAAVFGSSILGVISPEVIQAIGQGLANLLRRATPYIAGVGGLAALYVLQPDLLGSLLTLGIICLGVWVMIRPLLRR